MNSALMSRESGAWLFHVSPGNGVAKGWPTEIVRGRTRARRWGKSGGKEKKSVWIRAESDIKYIRIFSRDSPRRYGRSESWISFWWVFPFRLLLHFNPPRKPTVQSQPLNTNVNALGCPADFLLVHFALLAIAVASPGTHFHGRFQSSSWEWDGGGVAWLFRGCFDRGKNWDICLVRFLSHGGPLEQRINRWKLVLKKGIFAHMPTAKHLLLLD